MQKKHISIIAVAALAIGAILTVHPFQSKVKNPFTLSRLAYAEVPAGTCCDGKGTCIVGRVAIADAFSVQSGPCPN